MKKKTRFKSRNDLKGPFWTAVIICLIGAAVCYWFFHSSFFRALTKMDEDPIATITFKYKTAERKFIDRVIWDRLRQNSPVYNGDTIHTADISEATIWFDDGTTLALAENTMAQVFLHDDGTLGADLAYGDADVDSASDGGGFFLSSDGKRMEVRKGSRLSARKKKGGRTDFLALRGSSVFEDGEELGEGKSIGLEDGEKSAGGFAMFSPFPNQKFLQYSEESYPVNFSWDSSSGANLSLTVASDRGFREIVQDMDVSGMTSVSVPLPKGVYYWKLIDPAQSTGSEPIFSGRFQIVQSLKPSLLVPAENFSYTYRKQTPSVRFIWSESEAATAYNFEISRSPDMSNPVVSQRSSSSSIIISTLGAGTYYYRVTPYYVVNRVGLSNPSETGSFKIVQRDLLNPPVLVSPANNSFVDKTKGSASLSWRMSDERMTYNLTVSKFQSLASPIIQRKTAENYVTISKSELEEMSDGEYFWAVTQTDSEGNESARSAVRTFYAMSGEIEQRTIFPPDNYTLWHPLLGDMRFTWKSNLSMAQYIQFSRDPAFSNIVYEREINGSAFSGVSLGTGEYYWRISTKSASFSRSTQAKRLSVVSEIPSPAITFPNQSNKAIIRPGEKCVFTWTDEGKMDYYRIKIFKAGSDKPFFDESFISGRSLPVSVENLEEGNYRWEIQGYAYEGERSSRRSSLLTEAYFALRKIHPVKLVSPENKSVIGGWDAIEKPPVLVWSSAENFSQAQIILTKRDGENPGRQVYPQRGYQFQLEPLTSGTYEWTVSARTMDDLDISSQEKLLFIVEPLPPFPVPAGAKTDGGRLFDAAYLRKNPYIMFRWQQVPRANSYILEIFGKDDGKLFITETLDGNDITSFKLDELTRLSKGSFTWRVRAVLFDEERKRILVDGIPVEDEFTIDYSMNSGGGKRKDTGTLYAE